MRHTNAGVDRARTLSALPLSDAPGRPLGANEPTSAAEGRRRALRRRQLQPPRRPPGQARDQDLIALREDRRGPALLAGLGVAPERIMVTGDDAIELAHRVRSAAPGTDLGVCLRIADYSPVGAAVRAAVTRAVQRCARNTGTRLCPLIVSEFRGEDRRSTLPLVAGYPRVRRPLGRYVAAVDVAARVSQCRVVVTGAYHLAVFALSQGIPVVGLSASTYYDDKLFGLQSMFGGGITPLRLDDPSLEERIVVATRSAWAEAPRMRADLLAGAAEQIRLSHEAFDRAFALVDDARQSAG